MFTDYGQPASREELLDHIERLRAALASAEKTFNNIRGAIESNQVVDKDAHGMAVRGRDACRAVLSVSQTASPNTDNKDAKP